MQTEIHSVTTYSWSENGACDTPTVNLYDSKERAVKEAKWNLLNACSSDFQISYHGHYFHVESKEIELSKLDSYLDKDLTCLSRKEDCENEHFIVVLQKH